MALAEPEVALTLTRVGDDWPTVKRRLNQYRQSLRRQGLAVQDAYHVEENPKLDGHHVHMWCWGSPLRQEMVEAAAASAGLGSIALLREAFVPSTGRLDYGVKSVLPQNGNPADAGAGRRFLDVNGGRLVHPTRDFWRDGAGGRRLSGVREAATVAACRRRSLERRVPGLVASFEGLAAA